MQFEIPHPSSTTYTHIRLLSGRGMAAVVVQPAAPGKHHRFFVAVFSAAPENLSASLDRIRITSHPGFFAVVFYPRNGRSDGIPGVVRRKRDMAHRHCHCQHLGYNDRFRMDQPDPFPFY